MTTINFQQIYEDNIEDVTKELLQLPRHYIDLSHESKRFIEDLLTAGYERALEDALDPTVLEETSALSKEMSSQLDSFSELVNSFLSGQNMPSGN
tara:strand:- start:1159 stop:1443 length:285 start_codon:yes stop_codon:yes gene_type:complete